MDKNNIPVKNLNAAKLKITADNKCQHCTGSKCCQYATVAVDTPRSIRAFDHLLWQVSHETIHLFKDSDGWYLLILQPCQHLASDGKCLIYTKRPWICREHDNQSCEFDYAIDENCELYFTEYHAFDDYCRKRFKTWDKRFA